MKKIKFCDLCFVETQILFREIQLYRVRDDTVEKVASPPLSQDMLDNKVKTTLNVVISLQMNFLVFLLSFFISSFNLFPYAYLLSLRLSLFSYSCSSTLFSYVFLSIFVFTACASPFSSGSQRDVV
jgi:hypothetical protein